MRIGEALAEEARRRGMVLFVDTDRMLRCHPARLMGARFLRLLKQHRDKVKRYLIAIAVRQD